MAFLTALMEMMRVIVEVSTVEPPLSESMLLNFLIISINGTETCMFYGGAGGANKR